MVVAADQNFVYENVMVYTCIYLQRDGQAEFILGTSYTSRWFTHPQMVTCPSSKLSGPNIQSSYIDQDQLVATKTNCHLYTISDIYTLYIRITI